MSHEELREALAASLALSADWREAMLAVRRHLFVPERGFAVPEGCGEPYPLNRADRPQQWLRAVYSDTAIITQRDGGAEDPATNNGEPTSSLSAPGIAFRFLEVLDPRPHDRVLEIGTGTGYTAAVLSARLGEQHVTSIEVDPQVARQAADNLAAAGYGPSLITADGADGNPGPTPYDRIHATCAVREVPFAWIEQTRPGGVIVTPWQPGGDTGLILRLVAADGVAYGRFRGRCGYMTLRSQGRNTWNAHDADQAETSRTELDPRSVRDAGDACALVACARAPGLAMRAVTEDDGSFSLLLSEAGNPAGSWAACDYEPEKTSFEVNQYGERHLWDELSAAYLHWVRLGCPELERFGLTITAQGQQLWIDTPASRVLPGNPERSGT